MDVVASKLFWAVPRTLKKIPRVWSTCTCNGPLRNFMCQSQDMALMIKVASLRFKRKRTKAQEVLTLLHGRGYTMMTSEDFPGRADLRQLLDDPSNHVVVFKKEKANEYVVAIRGTNLFSLEDLLEDIGVSLELTHLGDRVAEVRNLVDHLASVYGQESVTITGHSLGAIVGYIIEREFYLTNRKAKKKHLQLGHYFNLPFIPLDRFLGTILCRVESKLIFLRKANISEPLLKAVAALSAAFAWWYSEEERLFMNDFNNLVDWSPHVYVQRYDTISQSILNYFENRKMGDYGQANTAFTPMLVKCGARALQHLPSARFIIANHGLDTFTSHRLSNWIRAECCRVKVVDYRSLQPQPFNFLGIRRSG